MTVRKVNMQDKWESDLSMASSPDDGDVAAACLALMLAGLFDATTAGAMLRALPASATAEAVLAYAKVTRASVNASYSKALALVQRGQQAGVEAIALCSPRYPAALGLLVDAPPILYVRGNSSALACPQTVTVAGTRNASANGKLIAQRMAQYLSANGWSVVSGLARGIDAAAQTGALQGALGGVAVVGQGLGLSLPKALATLADRIVESAGALVSEHPYGVRIRDASSVSLARMQVGLSRGCVIVEGGASSSARLHAQVCAREQRLIFAVLPQQGVFTHSALPQALVEHGAVIIGSRADYPALLAGLHECQPIARASS